jgi:hypothetical protein
MRGRAMGMVTLAIGSAPIGSLQLGFLADTVGVSMAIGISSALSLVLVVVVGMYFGMFGRNLVGVPIREGESVNPEGVVGLLPTAPRLNDAADAGEGLLSRVPSKTGDRSVS